MKIALSTKGNTLESPMDSRFGRAARFLIYDTDKETYEILENAGSIDAAHGAGIKTAENIARLGVDCVITGHCGPNAFRVLKAAGIKTYNTDALTVSQALEQFKAGTLQSIDSADVGGHTA